MSANQPSRPLPDTRNAGAPYWRAAANGTLLVPRCNACAQMFWHPRPRCPHCGSADVGFIAGSGKGTIHTFTVVRQSGDPWFKGKVPYAVAIVELDEGIRMMTNIVDTPIGSIAIGQRVEVAFEAAGVDMAIPLFRVAGERA